MWRAAPPAGCSLVAPARAWLMSSPQGLEVAGVDHEGTLWWSRFGVFVPPEKIDQRRGHLANERYRAAALLRPGEVAGVTRTGVSWARSTDLGLRVRSTTPAELGDAVACFASPLTRELLAVCANGDVVRVPVPS
jgi:hypothetical protein